LPSVHCGPPQPPQSKAGAWSRLWIISLPQALDLALQDGDRAIDVIARIRALIKKAPPRNDAFETMPSI
jgi:hypothetical protein